MFTWFGTPFCCLDISGMDKKPFELLSHVLPDVVGIKLPHWIKYIVPPRNTARKEAVLVGSADRIKA